MCQNIKIDREKVRETVDYLNGLEESRRGWQPLNCLECFFDLSVENLGLCREQGKKCYGTCLTYLFGFRIDENPFKRE